MPLQRPPALAGVPAHVLGPLRVLPRRVRHHPALQQHRLVAAAGAWPVGGWDRIGGPRPSYYFTHASTTTFFTHNSLPPTQERDYFRPPPPSCHLLNETQCQSPANPPVGCPDSSWCDKRKTPLPLPVWPSHPYSSPLFTPHHTSIGTSPRCPPPSRPRTSTAPPLPTATRARVPRSTAAGRRRALSRRTGFVSCVCVVCLVCRLCCGGGEGRI